MAMLTTLQEGLQPDHCLVHLRLEHHIGVKDNVDLPVVQGYVVPLGESGQSTVIVASAPGPDPEQRNGAPVAAHEGIALLDALRNKEGHGGITEHLPCEGVNIQDHACARGSLVFNRPALL